MNKTELLASARSTVKVLRVETRAVEPDEDHMAQIRPFLLRDWPIEDLYIRKLMLANDQVDRSHERFDLGYLKRFAETIVGKSVLVGHDYGTAPVGRFFAADVETDDRGWNWVAPWFYMPRSGGNELARDNIDSGVWSYVSIGAAVDYAGLTCDICGKPYYVKDSDGILCPHYAGEVYDEVVCTTTWTADRSDMDQVEAVEGSIVYLGCQYEAAVAKSASAQSDLRSMKENLLQNEVNKMPPTTDGNPTHEHDEHLAKISELETKITALEPMAEVGTKLLARLVDNIKRLAACLDDAVTPSVVGYITDVDELVALEARLDEAWAAKNPSAPQGIVEAAEPETTRPIRVGQSII